MLPIRLSMFPGLFPGLVGAAPSSITDCVIERVLASMLEMTNPARGRAQIAVSLARARVPVRLIQRSPVLARPVAAGFLRFDVDVVAELLRLAPDRV